MTPDDKLQQRPHHKGGTFDICSRIDRCEGKFRGKVRIRRSFMENYEMTFKSASQFHSTYKAAQKDAKELLDYYIKALTGNPI